jgi:dTMP kinase
MNRVSGRFITIEGIEGAGKSTNLDFVQGLLEGAGRCVLRTREPGGTPLGEEVRELLLGHREGGMDETAELLLMFGARAEHLSRSIRPALQRGDWVLCDRFTDATYAYQGGGRGLPREPIRMLEELVQSGLRPDLTLLLDLPVEEGLQRAGRRSAPDRFERETRDFFEGVRNEYLRIASAEPQRMKVIDASHPLPEVQQQIRRVVEELLQRS